MCGDLARAGGGTLLVALGHAGRDTPRPCQPNGVGWAARPGVASAGGFVRALAALSCAAPTRFNTRSRCSCAALRQLQRGRDERERSPLRRGAGAATWRVGTRRGAAWGKRAACCDDFDDDDEPCSARRPRASARGGTRAAATDRRRPNARLCCAARSPVIRSAACANSRRSSARKRAEPRGGGPHLHEPRIRPPTGHERAFTRVARAERAPCDD